MPVAFELAERYRTPVIVLADGILGQAMEPVSLSFRTPEEKGRARRDFPRLARRQVVRPRPFNN